MNFYEALLLLLIALKLTHQIDWSWWLVLLPAIGAAIVLAAIYSVVGVRWIMARRRESSSSRNR